MPNRQSRNCCDVLEAASEGTNVLKRTGVKNSTYCSQLLVGNTALHPYGFTMVSRTHENSHRNFCFPGFTHTQLNNIFMLQNPDNDYQKIPGEVFHSDFPNIIY